MVFVNKKLINEKCHYTEKNKPQNVYDPRTKLNVISDNPALILAEIILKLEFFTPTEEFWENIEKLANYCDKKI